MGPLWGKCFLWYSIRGGGKRPGMVFGTMFSTFVRSRGVEKELKFPRQVRGLIFGDPHAPRMSKRNSFSNITRTPCPGLTPSTQQRHHTTLFNLFHPMISLVSSGVAGSLPTSRHIPTNASINSPLLVALAPFGK